MTLATYQSEEMMGPGHRYPGSMLRYSPPLSLSESTPTHTDHTEGTPSFTASSPSCSSDVLGTVLTTVAWESPPLLPSLLSSHILQASCACCCPPSPAVPHLSFPLACLHGAFCLSVCLSVSATFSSLGPSKKKKFTVCQLSVIFHTTIPGDGGITLSGLCKLWDCYYQGPVQLKKVQK